MSWVPMADKADIFTSDSSHSSVVNNTMVTGGNSQWKQNWILAKVVNSHLVCDPTIQQPGYDLPQQQWSQLNRFHMQQGHCSASRNGELQTLICVLVVRPRRCPTLSNPVLWQSWMVACPAYTLQIKMPFPGWPIMAHDMHMRRLVASVDVEIKSCIQ